MPELVNMHSKVQGDVAHGNVRSMTMAGKPPVDWEAVEPVYRAGIRSLKNIGAEFGVSDAGIIKHAEKHGWTRDLSAKIRAKAEAKVSAAAVSAEVSANRAITERQTVEANAEVQYQRIIAQRTDVSAARELVKTLFAELVAQTGDLAALEQLGELMAGSTPDQQDRLNGIYRKIISLPGRIDSVKKLSDAMSTLIRLERQVFGIDDGNETNSFEEALRKVQESVDA